MILYKYYLLTGYRIAGRNHINYEKEETEKNEEDEAELEKNKAQLQRGRRKQRLDK